MKYTFPQLPAHQAIEMDQRETSLPHKPEPLCSMPWTPMQGEKPAPISASLNSTLHTYTHKIIIIIVIIIII